MLRSVALLCAAIAVVKALNTELDDDWNSYKKYHNKKYSSEDEVRRRSIWEGHIKLIEKHNREFDMGIHTYTLGTNEYADMTNGEFVSMMNGYRMSNSTSTNPIYRQPSHVGALPDTVDWRKEGYVTEVKNQKQCGSCWAFSTTGSLEGQHFKASGKLVSLSEQNLVDCSSKEGNHGCQGGLMDNAFKYVKSNNGIDTEQSYPYKGHKSLWCHFSQSNIGATLTGYTDVKSGSEQDLMSAVATVGPISVAIDASHSSFQLYKSGVYTEKQCSSTRLDHGVLAVGYGSSSGKNFWLVKNSWGATWGMDGYIMMAKDSNNMCGIATQASYPLV